MRRFTTYLVAVLIAGSAALVAQKAQTAEDLDKAMKKIGPASGAMNKAIKAMAWADARKQVEALEDALEDTHNFWVVTKRADAVKMSNDSVAKIKSLKVALDAAPPDTAKVTAAAKEFASTCLGCHKVYRAQDENQQYVLKPGI